MLKSLNSKRTSFLRKAVTLVELSIIMILIAVFILTIFIIYPKITTSASAEVFISSTAGLLAALESSKIEGRGVYPSKPTTALGSLPSTDPLISLMGGANGIKDIVGWTYSCSSGSPTTINITTSAFENNHIASSFILKFNGRFTDWTATDIGSDKVLLTRSNITCQ